MSGAEEGRVSEQEELHEQLLPDGEDEDAEARLVVPCSVQLLSTVFLQGIKQDKMLSLNLARLAGS